MTRPLPGVGRERVEKVLEDARLAFENARGVNGQPFDRYNAYVRESNTQIRMLNGAVSASDVARLIATPRYWTLQGLDPGAKGGTLASIVDLELEDVIARLDAARTTLVTDAQRFTGAQAVVVPDTNVYVHHAVEFQDVPWHLLAPAANRIILAVPMLVVDELDQRKRDHKPISRDDKTLVSSRARTTLRTLEAGFFQRGEGSADDLSFMLTDEPAVQVALWLDDPNRATDLDADSNIIDFALGLREIAGLPVVLTSHDTAMRFRARAVGLPSEMPPKPQDAPF